MTFEERRRYKWKAGRIERGMDESDPFAGDPVIEALDETPDLANYIEEAVAQGRIPDYVGDELLREVASIDMALAMYR